MKKKDKVNIFYGSYDPWIKAAIALTGRVDLFPEFNIPRTTALYWIDSGFRLEDPIFESLTNTLIELYSKCEKLEKNLVEIERTKILQKEVFEIMGFQLSWKHMREKNFKIKILSSIYKAMEFTTRNQCLETLGLSLSRYKKWKKEERGCGASDAKTCPKLIVNQLTFGEIQTMRSYVESADFAHFPLKSLQQFARKNGTLFCAYSTWKKYIDLYEWKRPRKKFRKKVNKVGIKAICPNEIWHLDLSYFILPDDTKLFIQIVVDNYSRYVLAWQVLTSYDGSKTADLLKQALLKKNQLKHPILRLIVDGGSENKGEEVQKLEEKGKFIKQVAQFEISFSNSMVERVFSSLKNNYLYHHKILNYKSLLFHCNKWFNDHNDVIPHSAFKGETPFEKFTNSWSETDYVRILVKQKEAITSRIQNNQKIFCNLCEAI